MTLPSQADIQALASEHLSWHVESISNLLLDYLDQKILSEQQFMLITNDLEAIVNLTCQYVYPDGSVDYTLRRNNER